MADPKIKYDIEAAVSGTPDAAALAKELRNVGDALEGDLKTQALQAADALEALGSKQRAIDSFQALKRETTTLTTALDGATAVVDRLGNELPAAAAKTQAMAAAEGAASSALTEARASVERKREALAKLREENQGAARRTDEYRAAVAGLQAGIKTGTAEIKTHQSELSTAARATTTAQNAEAALRKEYDLALGSATKLSTELRIKNAVLGSARDQMQSMGVSTTGLVQSEANLRTAVAQVRQEVQAMAPAYQAAASASSAATQTQAQNQRTLREGMTSISTQLQQIQNIATLALGGGMAGGLIKDLTATADEFQNLQARIKLVTGEGAAFQTSWTGVTQVALKTNSALEETGTLFARIAKAGKDAGMSAQAAQTDALGLTTTINQSIQLSGASADASKAAITQLIQGLQSGVLRGEEFNSVMEQAPRLAQALADGLGVTTGELRKMAEQGALTTSTVTAALRGQADTVASEFDKLPPTVGRALQNLSTQWTLYVGAADKGLVSSANAAKIVSALANNLDLVVGSLTAAGKVFAALKISALVADFTRWAATTLTATAAVEANTAASAKNTVAQQANSVAHTQNATAQAASTAASAANTAARAANAKAWGEVGAFTRAATGAQEAATLATARNTAAMAANAGQVASAGLVWRGASALVGPWGIALAALTPEILSMGRALGEQTARLMGWGKVMDEAEAKLRAQDQIMKDRAESLARQNALYEEAKNKAFDLTKASVGLIAEFDKLIKSGDSAAEAISKIGKDFDLSNSPGIRNASSALDKLLADGKLTATQFQEAWAKALEGQDLAKFEVLARNAFASARKEAIDFKVELNKAIESGASEEVIKAMRLRLEGMLGAVARESDRVAQMLDNVLRVAVNRTGLDFDVLQGKIGASSRSAINDVDAIVQGLDRLKAQGVDAGQVLATSLSKAINTADGQAAIENLRGRIESLRSVLGDTITNGLLDQARDKALALADAVDKATPGINSVREAMERLGVTSDNALREKAEEGRAAYEKLRDSGTASAREIQASFTAMAQRVLESSGQVGSMGRILTQVSLEAQGAANGMTVSFDAAGQMIVTSMNAGAAATGNLKTGVDNVNGSLRTQIDLRNKLNSLGGGGTQKEEPKTSDGFKANADGSAKGTFTNNLVVADAFAMVNKYRAGKLTSADLADAKFAFDQAQAALDYMEIMGRDNPGGQSHEFIQSTNALYNGARAAYERVQQLVLADKKNAEAAAKAEADKAAKTATPTPAPAPTATPSTPTPAPAPSSTISRLQVDITINGTASGSARGYTTPEDFMTALESALKALGK